MAHLSPPFPTLGQIETYTPPRLAPVRAVRHVSPWTGKSVVYRQGMRWQGSVVLRRQAPRREALVAALPDGPALSLIDTPLLEQLADGYNTFDLQLPVKTLPFADYAFSVDAAVDAARSQLKATIASTSNLDDAKGSLVRMGTRYYMIAETVVGNTHTVVYFTPHTLPSDVTKMVSLYPAAGDDAIPRIRARLTSYAVTPTNRYADIEGARTFGWEEALE